MARDETRDGIRLRNIVSTLVRIAGVGIREGTNHPLVAFAEGNTRPCPIATSTNARRMVVPWVREVTGYTDVKEIYSALRDGRAISA